MTDQASEGNVLELQAPEGFEYGFKLYVTSDATELSLVISIDGFTSIRQPKPIGDLLEFLARMGTSTRRMAEAASDWRVMTREEIDAYKAEEGEELP